MTDYQRPRRQNSTSRWWGKGACKKNGVAATKKDPGKNPDPVVEQIVRNPPAI